MTQAERMAKLEEKVARLETVAERIEGKLDDIIALRNRGMGAFWLAATIIGSGMIGLAMQIISWVKGH